MVPESWPEDVVPESWPAEVIPESCPEEVIPESCPEDLIPESGSLLNRGGSPSRHCLKFNHLMMHVKYSLKHLVSKCHGEP